MLYTYHMDTEGHSSGLPSQVTINMAAAIAARPRRVVQRWIDAGLLPVELTGKRKQAVRLSDLAVILERAITPELYLAADRRLDRLRATNRRYNDRRVRDSAAATIRKVCPDDLNHI